MKIAMLGLKGIPVSGDGGGIERHVEELAERLVRRGHTVYVYVHSSIVPPSAPPRWRGVRLIRIPTIERKNFATIVHTFLASVHVLFLPVDVVHYHGVGPATMSWISRIFKPWARTVVTFHSLNRFHEKWGPFARVYLRFGEWCAVRIPHHTIVVSHTLLRYVQRRFRKIACFIPNGVEVRSIRHTDELENFHIRRREYVLVVARLVKQKGIHYLIQAFKGLDTNKKLVIVGAPSYTEDYAAYLAQLAADDPRVIFTGFQQGKALDELFAHAYLYVHPSDSEGLSLTILEAMSFGTPVLISNIPENREGIDHVGFSFERGNIRDLRRKLTDLLSKSTLLAECGRKGREFMRTQFNGDHIALQTERLYNTGRCIPFEKKITESEHE